MNKFHLFYIYKTKTTTWTVQVHYNLRNHPTFHHLDIRRERFVGLSSNLFSPQPPCEPLSIYTNDKVRCHLDHKTRSLLQKWRLRRLKVSIPHGYYFSLSRNKYFLLYPLLSGKKFLIFFLIISKRRALKHKIIANAC